MKEAESEKYNSLQKHVTEYQKAGENFMASSMIHLAIIRCIIVKTEFNNLDRLRLGVILDVYKRQLYDILDIKKETSNPIEP